MSANRRSGREISVFHASGDHARGHRAPIRPRSVQARITGSKQTAMLIPVQHDQQDALNCWVSRTDRQGSERDVEAGHAEAQGSTARPARRHRKNSRWAPLPRSFPGSEVWRRGCPASVPSRPASGEYAAAVVNPASFFLPASLFGMRSGDLTHLRRFPRMGRIGHRSPHLTTSAADDGSGIRVGHRGNQNLPVPTPLTPGDHQIWTDGRGNQGPF